MSQASARTETKSAASKAFAYYLRTGRRLPESEFESNRLKIGLKFNQNHDPSNGQFTFSSGGSASLARGSGSAIRPVSARPQSAGSVASPSQARRKRSSNHTETVRMTDAVPYQRADGMTYKDPRSGTPMLKPADVRMENTIRFAKMFSSPFNRYTAATIAFDRGGVMDFQRTKSNLRAPDGSLLIDRRYIAFGNYNFGVYAAASGMGLDEALDGAGALYNMTIHRGRGFDNSGLHYRNPRNSTLIVSGYHDYMNGKIGH